LDRGGRDDLGVRDYPGIINVASVVRRMTGKEVSSKYKLFQLDPIIRFQHAFEFSSCNPADSRLSINQALRA